MLKLPTSYSFPSSQMQLMAASDAYKPPIFFILSYVNRQGWQCHGGMSVQTPSRCMCCRCVDPAKSGKLRWRLLTIRFNLDLQDRAEAGKTWLLMKAGVEERRKLT